MKNIGISLNIKNSDNILNRTVMNGDLGSKDFQVGLNDDGEVAILLDDIELSASELNAFKKHPYTRMRRVKKYLYEVWYDSIDYDYGIDQLNRMNGFKGGLCSAVRNGNFYGRNFDFIYDEGAEFIVHCKRNSNRYASVSVCGIVSGLTDEFVQSGKTSSKYRLIPFNCLDGINEKGVFANANVVPTDLGSTTIAVPSGEIEETLPVSIVCRYIIDNFGTASDAAEYIGSHVAMYPSSMLAKMGYECHIMFGDKTNTYLLENINNQVIISDMTPGANCRLAGKSYMTNFYLSNVVFNEDGTVYTPATIDGTRNAISVNNITSHGCGLERYNIIVNNFNSANTEDGMRNLMRMLTYSNAYRSNTDPFWYTEFVGDYTSNGVGDLTVATNPINYAPAINRSIKAFNNRSRDPSDSTYGTWHTTHSSIYDIENKLLHITVQEDGEELTFGIDSTPELPTDEGLYAIRVSITNGSPIYQWVAL